MSTRDSLWDNYDDDGVEKPRKAEKPRGPRPNPDYRPVNDELTYDGYSSSDYGGYGWNGKSSRRSRSANYVSPRPYHYEDSIYDAGDAWYQRDSFQYDRLTDYSPSSLFRSTFSRYLYDADNEAKNKAIRALRNLTRSANTLVDKSASARQDFVVQFSQGYDSNGPSAELNSDKRRVVFVSPDDLVATKTPEDEDRIVDELTGFVLLRVQLAQDIAETVIEKINQTGASISGAAAHMLLRLAPFNPDAPPKPMADLNAADIENISASVADSYLAGMLAKSLLMRAARKKIVKDWNGFTPYFIRHAKKFEAVKANLSGELNNLETIVGALSYNSLADEAQLPLAEDIDAIARAHLDAEVLPENLLEICQKLIAALRAHLLATGKTPDGDIAKTLTEILNFAVNLVKPKDSSKSALKNMLSKFGHAIHDTDRAAAASGASCENNEKNLRELLEKIQHGAAGERLLKKFDAAAKAIKEALEKEGSTSDVNSIAHGIAQDLRREFARRPAGVEAIEQTRSAPKTPDVIDECLKTIQTSPNGVPAELAADYAKKFLEQLNAARKLAKANMRAARKTEKQKVGDLLEATAKISNEILARAAAEKQKLTELNHELAKDPAAAEMAGEINDAQKIIDTALAHWDRIVEGANSVAADCRVNIESKLDAVRSSSGLQTVLNKTHAQSYGLRHKLYTDLSFNWLTRRWDCESRAIDFTRLLSQADDAEARERMIEPTAESVSNGSAAGPSSALSALIAQLGGATLEALLQQLDKGDDKAISSLPIEMQKLFEILAKYLNGNKENKTAEITNAETAGKEFAEQLKNQQIKINSVDQQLFGETVKADTTVLTGENISKVNDESRNDPEEEYVAYLSHNSAKPTTKLETEGRRSCEYNSWAKIKEVRKKYRGAIERVRNVLQFQAGKRVAEAFGMRSGDLDEGSLHKLRYDSEYIWTQKTTSRLPDVAVGILVDQSGSMSGVKIERARNLCIVLAEALKKISGVRLYVYGHTANRGSADMTIFEHYTPTLDKIENLGGISAHANNYDGYAVKDVAKRLAQDPAKRKYMFVIADGLPSGHGYSGDAAEKHVASVCRFVRERLKINLNAFAVVSPEYAKKFKKQYGENHVVIVNDVMKCLPQIVRFLRNALQKERKLVDTVD
ncbi:VWA domain-containing protein [bacterium]|nr:VWA domain-containing protein [bacterium]